jgi:hypothetical protein
VHGWLAYSIVDAESMQKRLHLASTLQGSRTRDAL